MLSERLEARNVTALELCHLTCSDVQCVRCVLLLYNLWRRKPEMT